MKTLSIGRSSQCDIIIPHNNVSRIHARISVVGGKYVFEDVSKHGSYIGGRLVKSDKVTIAPGTEVILAGQVPLPWGQIYSQLPLQGANSFDAETSYEGCGYPNVSQGQAYNDESIGIGWGLLAFFFPISGWIMYFVWKDDSPRRASQANVIAWVSFVLNLLTFIAASA